MKKHLFFAVLAAAALASCSDDAAGLENKDAKPQGDAILFTGQQPNLSRAAEGADAAALLNNKFRVYGTYHKNGESTVVFDNYQVLWNGNKGSDETNEYGWTYLGASSLATTPTIQDVKYWDLSAEYYRFVAFGGLADDKVIISTDENKLQVDASNMYDLFLSDLRCASKNGAYGANGGNNSTVMYGKEVKFTFSRMTSRVRIGFYETIPGYAVANVRFYYGDNASTKVLSTKTEPGLRGTFPISGDYVISYGDHNQPVADFQIGGATADHVAFEKLNYTSATSSVIATPEKYLDAAGNVSDAPVDAYLSTTAAAPTMATVASANIDGTAVANSEWLPILPYTKDISTPEAQKANNLILRVDFDLVPLDGTKAIINVYNARAVIPAEWAQWKPNYAYTYIFKITDNIKGSTTPPDDDPDDPEPNPDPDGPAITPIVFDAAVSAVEDFNQTTITGVTSLGGDAITTYSATTNTTDQGEYGVGEEIVVSSYSRGRWSIAHSDTEPDRRTIDAAYSSYVWDVLAGDANGTTINQNAKSFAKFTAAQAGYYIVELRYLPIGRVDTEDQYVNVYKIVKIHE